MNMEWTMPTPIEPPSATPIAPPDWRLRLGRWRGGLDAALVSATGTRHSENEDSGGYRLTGSAPRFCAVADGVGGGAFGQVASRALIEHCAAAPRDTGRDPQKLADWLRQGDGVVRAALSKFSERPGAATLVAAWWLSEGWVNLLNVGDCRAYRLRPGFLRGYSITQLTTDQTYRNLGRTPPANGSPDDPACMVGVGAVGHPPVKRQRLREGDLLLLCSDGLHKFLDDAALAEIVARESRRGASLESICRSLVEAAKRHGSHDDVSALLVERRRWLGAAKGYWLALMAALIAVVAAT